MRTDAKSILLGASFLFAVACASSCGTKQNRECETHITEEIHVGVSVETADAVLKKCGFKTTLDPAKNTLYGDKRVEGTIVVERTQVLVTLDSAKKVAAVTVSKGLIGP
jgi:hypothetical protein